MIWHLFAVLIVGLCGGALLHLLRKLSGGRLPKWIISAGAGLCMFGYHAYYDYNWYEFKASQLPTGSIVIYEKNTTSFFKPWSYISPVVNAFTVFDGTSKRSEQNHQILVEYFTYHFLKDPSERQVIFESVLNCTTQERATLEKDKSVRDTIFEKVDTTDKIYQRVCN